MFDKEHFEFSDLTNRLAPEVTDSAAKADKTSQNEITGNVSGCSKVAVLSPGKVEPLLKAVPRKTTNKGGQRSSSSILISTPVKEIIEKAATEREEKRGKQTLRKPKEVQRKQRSKKKGKISYVEQDSEHSEASSVEYAESSDDSLYVGSNEDGEDLSNSIFDYSSSSFDPRPDYVTQWGTQPKKQGRPMEGENQSGLKIHRQKKEAAQFLSGSPAAIKRNRQSCQAIRFS